MKVKGRTTKQGRDQRIVVVEASGRLKVRFVLEEELEERGGRGTQDSLLSMEHVYEEREGFWFNANFFKTRS